MIAATWTKRDFDLIETLCCRVRVLSLENIYRGWWSTDHKVAHVEADVDRLVRAGLVQSVVWTAKVVLVNDAPLFAWKPPLPPPDFEELANLVRHRWPKTTRRVQAFVATSKAARLFGSSANNIPPAHHRSHDLILAAVFVHYRTKRPDEARHWLGEDALPMAEKGVKNPDAFLLDANGKVRRVIESAGHYSQDQIETFHRYCVQTELPYELW